MEILSLPEIRSRYRWNAVAGRYINPDGTFVSFREVRSALDLALDKSERSLIDLGVRLQSGEIGLSSWQSAMHRRLKEIHTASASLAKGGWAQMTPADYGRVGLRVKRQLYYLNRFAKQIERGLPLDGRFRTRVQMYAQSGRLTYHMVERAEQAIRGAKYEKNILAPGDNCGECPTLSKRGWVPIGSLPLVGMRECHSHCRCSIDYK